MIRKEAMAEWGDVLMFGGAMPDGVVSDLSTAARITGLVFDALKNRGADFENVNDKPGLIKLSVEGDDFVCHKSAIPSISGFLEQVYTMDVLKDKANEPAKKDEQEERSGEPEPDPEPAEAFFEPDSEPDEEPSTYISTKRSVSSAGPLEEEESHEEAQDELRGTEEADEAEDEGDNAESEEGSPSVMYPGKNDFFNDELNVKADDFVYTMLGATLSHYKGKGKSIEVQAMVAPLKISKISAPSVPILVSVFCDGQVITSSSYNQKDGKSLVTLEVQGFYLLFRGQFNADGEFSGEMMTTSMSATQGDILTVTSQEHYGREPRSQSRNGHVKFHETVLDRSGVIEVFPFGDPEDNEFVAMLSNEDFVDYIYLSPNVPLMKAIYYAGDKKKQLSCEWNNGALQVHTREV